MSSQVLTSSKIQKLPLYFRFDCFLPEKMIAGTTHKACRDRAALYEDLNLKPENAVSLKQCHGNQIEWVNRGVLDEIPETDALITRERGVLLTIRTADCVPLFIFDPVTSTIALIHAGWRGAKTGIVAKTVKELEVQIGTKPENLIVALGPMIRCCCYEFDSTSVPEFRPFMRGHNFDLSGYINEELSTCGVSRDSIFDSGFCTLCHPENFHSYRRDKEKSGRMISFMMLL